MNGEKIMILCVWGDIITCMIYNMNKNELPSTSSNSYRFVVYNLYEREITVYGNVINKHIMIKTGYSEGLRAHVEGRFG